MRTIITSKGEIKMYLENYSNYMESLKANKTPENFEKTVKFLETLTMIYKIDLISIGLVSYCSYLDEVMISLSETKEDLSINAQWLIHAAKGFATYLLEERYISKLNFTPFEEEYYELATTLKEGLKSYKKSIRLGMTSQNYKIQNDLMNLICEAALDKIHDLNNPKSLLDVGVLYLASNKRDYNGGMKNYKKELRKDVEFDDHDIYLLNKLIDFINISSKYKYSLDDAMVMLNEYNGK